MSASSIKKSIRIFPKSEKVDIQIALDICNKLIEKIKCFNKQLFYRIDLQGNYIELLFNAPDGEHYLNIDFENQEYWELAGSSFGGADWIREVKNTENVKEDAAIYFFDKIEFKGNQKKLNRVLPNDI